MLNHSFFFILGGQVNERSALLATRIMFKGLKISITSLFLIGWRMWY